MLLPWKKSKGRYVRHALIMAAGRGMRMLPLTDSVPKPLAPFKDATLIADRISAITKAVDHVHITVGYKAAAVAQHVMELGVNTVLNTEGKGNAWWIYNTFLKLVDEPVVVLTCDNVIELDFKSLAREYAAFGGPACMVVPVKPVPGLEGDYIFHDRNVVKRFDRARPGPTYCSGIQIVNPAKINRLTSRTESFTSVWAQLIRKKQVYCSNVQPTKWFAADTMEQLARLNAA